MLKKFKVISFLLVLVLMLSLVGCSNNAEQTKTKEPDKSEEPAKTSNDSVLAQAVSDYYTNMGNDIYKIAQGEFVEKVKVGEDMFILDIRQSDAYEEAHVKGAVNAAWGTAISDNLNKLPKSKPIMVYCYSGQTAGQTVAALKLLGYDAVSLNGGIGVKANEPLGWANKAYSLVQ